MKHSCIKGLMENKNISFFFYLLIGSHFANTGHILYLSVLLNVTVTYFFLFVFYTFNQCIFVFIFIKKKKMCFNIRPQFIKKKNNVMYCQVW